MGSGPESDAVTLISAAPPEAPQTPYLYQATQNQITITWDTVYNGGSTILGYEVLMAYVGSSTSADAEVVAEPLFIDVTSLGVVNVVGRRFTISSSVTVGSQY